MAFVHEPDPALENVEHLKVAQVAVQAGGMQRVLSGRFLLDADHVSAELAVRGALDPQIAVLHEAAQAGLVDGVLGQTRTEELLFAAHGWPPSRAT
jgi:hypothetical protein